MGTMREIFAIFSGGRHGDDGLAAFGARGAANEINLATDAAVEIVADGVRTNLTGDVDLERGIDGHHFIVSGDDVGIVGVAAGMKFEHGIVVHEVEQLFGAQNES